MSRTVQVTKKTKAAVQVTKRNVVATSISTSVGPAGPAGADGTDGAGGIGGGFYTHVQSAPSNTWSVAHGLGYYPGGVSVVDSGGNICLGDVQYTSTNSLVVNFAEAFSGVAYFS